MKDDNKPKNNDSDVVQNNNKLENSGVDFNLSLKSADKVIYLDSPVGKDNLEVIALRKPKPGDLRGIKLLDVIQMDSAAAATLIQRISVNGFTTQHFYELEPADLLELTTEIATFFTKQKHLTA
ncbi:phage tail assembly protein [Zooshikella sp. RANM57]